MFINKFRNTEAGHAEQRKKKKKIGKDDDFNNQHTKSIASCHQATENRYLVAFLWICLFLGIWFEANEIHH